MKKISINYNQYKDNSPNSTINTIKNILNLYNIDVVEKKWFSNLKNGCYSVRIEFSNLPAGANGKGVNKEFALASAYGEFMERLQNLVLPVPFISEHLNMYDAHFIDEKTCEKNENRKFFTEIFDENTIDYLEKCLFENPSFNLSTLFIDVFNMNLVYLPYKILFLLTGSNGMCSGNTTEEALVEGLCEIFERYSIKMIYMTQPILPTIPITELENLYAYHLIKRAEKQGYTIIVKDCSFGVYPVVGVFFLHKRTSTYKFVLGSHPILDIAICRCITELFQGLTNPYFQNILDWEENRKVKIENQSADKKDLFHLEMLKSLKNGSGRYFISSIFEKNEKAYNKNLFLKGYYSNKQLLCFLFSILKRQNQKVFIRDLSFLGFPTYYIFINKLSIIEEVSYDSLWLSINLNKMQKILFNLDNSTEKEIYFLIDYIEVVKKKYSSHMIVENLMKHLLIPDDKIEKNINIDYLEALLYYKIGQYSLSLKYMSNYINKINDYSDIGKLNNLDFLGCFFYIIKLLKDGINIENIKLLASQLYEPSISNYVLFFIEKNRIFKNFFSLNNFKYKEELKKINFIINESMKKANFNQELLKKFIFSLY